MKWTKVIPVLNNKPGRFYLKGKKIPRLADFVGSGFWMDDHFCSFDEFIAWSDEPIQIPEFVEG